MDDRSELERSSVETQLLSLYTEKELLERELGTADPDELVDLVRRLERQIEELGAARGEPAPAVAPLSTAPDPRGAAFEALWARVGGREPEDALLYLDRLEASLEAGLLMDGASQAEPTAAAQGQQPAADGPGVLAAQIPKAALPAGSQAPLSELIASLRALAGEVCREFERSELRFEGETAGARWSVRCANGPAGS